jgi:acyl-CoA thioesterase-1
MLKQICYPVFIAVLCALYSPGSLADKNSHILVLGDSLSGAYGIDTDKGWVSLLQARIDQAKLDYTVINASVGGDTTRMGLNRIANALSLHKPEIVIIALGGNDGLRGLPFDEIEQSLSGIIEKCQTSNARVLLAGVRLPPNYGPVYNKKFAEIFQRLSERYDLPLVPKVLDNVAEHPELMQADGIHPTAAAQPRVMSNIWSQLEPMLTTPTADRN